MIFELERFAYTPMGTFGRLKANGFETCFTIEEVWNNNSPSISCIPIGVYPLKRGRFPKHGETFQVMEVPNRSAILFHVANTILDIEGCIGPGERLGMLGPNWAVLQSKSAYDRFMVFMKNVDEAKLRIYNYQGGIVNL